MVAGCCAVGVDVAHLAGEGWGIREQPMSREFVNRLTFSVPEPFRSVGVTHNSLARLDRSTHNPPVETVPAAR